MSNERPGKSGQTARGLCSAPAPAQSTRSSANTTMVPKSCCWKRPLPRGTGCLPRTASRATCPPIGCQRGKGSRCGRRAEEQRSMLRRDAQRGAGGMRQGRRPAHRDLAGRPDRGYLVHLAPACFASKAQRHFGKAVPECPHDFGLCFRLKIWYNKIYNIEKSARG